MTEGASTADRLIEEMREEFPAFRIVPKAGSSLNLAIDRALKLLTLGGQKTYMTEYFTVLGDTLYTPPGWEQMTSEAKVVLLRHERVHLRQRRRYTGPGMTFLYLLPFLPLGLAYGRARIEWEAYAETLRATYEVYGAGSARDPELKRKIVGRFTGPAYGWMWPFPRRVGQWYDQVLDELEKADESRER
ncbi:MAG: hypothetical protein H6718_13330 [Polyangiaceae bacterium]|nr:hypothetical protein [Polyangiaceae bacterium]MCB9607055.1 hypothetical protein [Polyangiaceae bacterium]